MEQVSGSPAADEQTAVALARLAERVDVFERHRTGHASRIELLAGRLGRRVGLADSELLDLRHAALGHALGLFALNLGALDRAGPLTLTERVELWRHPLLAEQQLAKRGASRHAQLLVRWHHEWWNGQGYPDMLAGNAIPLGARILRIAESYDAMCADRPHRAALDPLEARHTISEGRGIQYDPDLAATFLAMLDEVDVGPTATGNDSPRLPPITVPDAADGRGEGTE